MFYSIAMMVSSGKYGNSGNVFELTADISAVKNGSSDFMTEGVVTVLECIMPMPEPRMAWTVPSCGMDMY